MVETRCLPPVYSMSLNLGRGLTRPWSLFIKQKKNYGALVHQNLATNTGLLEHDILIILSKLMNKLKLKCSSRLITTPFTKNEAGSFSKIKDELEATIWSLEENNSKLIFSLHFIAVTMRLI